MKHRQNISPKDQRRFQAAIELHQQGKVAEAEKKYRVVLDRNPSFAPAWHLIGVLYFHKKEYAKAEQLVAKAIAIDDKNLDYYRDFASIQKSSGNYSGSADTLNKASIINPNALPIFLELGALRFQIGEYKKAINALLIAKKLAPQNTDVRNRIARCYFEMGDLVKASEHYGKSLKCNNDDFATLNNYASILRLLGKEEDGLKVLQDASNQNPDDLGLQWCQAEYLNKVRRYQEAEPLLRNILQMQPGNPPALSQLAITMEKIGQYGEALKLAEQAVAIDSTNAASLGLLGNLLVKCGRNQEANECLKKAFDKDPSNTSINSSMLFNLNYLDDLTALDCFQQHQKVGTTYRNQKHPIRENPKRASSGSAPLVVGYISPDFHNHSVAYYFDALLQAHDRKRIKAICYSDSTTHDEMNEKLRSQADKWQDIAGLSDAAVSQLIERDAPDIIVELAGHTANNRLGLLATRQAPIQITYLGYPNTTGVPTIDYRFTDSVADPVNITDDNHTEKLWRLNGGFLCYSPPSNTPMFGELPAKRNGYITFGSFNNRSKVCAQTLRLWSSVLSVVPDSQLLIKCATFSDESQRQSFLVNCEKAGIDQARLQLMGHADSTESHLAIYNDVDIALDTVPYNGTTTTCEALWMGVPVVTLAQESHASRVGASILTQLNQTALIANDELAFAEITQMLATDMDKLSKLREGLREQMKQSPLMDARRLASEMEAAYEKMLGDYVYETNIDETDVDGLPASDNRIDQHTSTNRAID